MTTCSVVKITHRLNSAPAKCQVIVVVVKISHGLLISTRADAAPDPIGIRRAKLRMVSVQLTLRTAVIIIKLWAVTCKTS